MNKFGKGNGIFIILLPLFIVAAVIIADTVISFTQNKTYKEVTERIIEEVINNEEISRDDYYEGIKRAYERRGYETERLVVEVDDYNFYVENEHSFFGLLTSLKKGTIEEKVKLFGIEYFTVRIKKNSKTFVKVNVSTNESDELIFEYTK